MARLNLTIKDELLQQIRDSVGIRGVALPDNDSVRIALTLYLTQRERILSLEIALQTIRAAAIEPTESPLNRLAGIAEEVEVVLR